MRGLTWNRRHNSRRFDPSASARRHSSSRASTFSGNGIENLMGPLPRSVHHVSEHLFTMSPVQTNGERLGEGDTHLASTPSPNLSPKGERNMSYSAAIFLAAFGLRCCTLGITS